MYEDFIKGTVDMEHQERAAQDEHLNEVTPLTDADGGGGLTGDPYAADADLDPKRAAFYDVSLRQGS
jgi:hypothetical protein